jgi:hypothetical protein
MKKMLACAAALAGAAAGTAVMAVPVHAVTAANDGAGRITMTVSGVTRCLAGNPETKAVTLGSCSDAQSWAITASAGVMYVDWIRNPLLCLGVKPASGSALLVRCDARDVTSAYLGYDFRNSRDAVITSPGPSAFEEILPPGFVTRARLTVVVPEQVTATTVLPVLWAGRNFIAEPGSAQDVWTLPKLSPTRKD